MLSSLSLLSFLLFPRSHAVTMRALLYTVNNMENVHQEGWLRNLSLPLIPIFGPPLIPIFDPVLIFF